MSYQKAYDYYGPFPRGRTLNAYERARPHPNSRDLYEGLNKESVGVIPKPTLDNLVSRQDIQPKNLTYLGSYNWIEATVPSIIVPGSPRVWVDRPLAISVALDHGYNFVDQNGHRMGSRTLFPLIRAVQDVESQSGIEGEDKFDWSSVDFVTDRNGLRKLLRWINAAPGDPPRDFRIDTQLAGSKTVLVNRWEQITKEQPGTRRSYGFNFEETMTVPSPGCERGTGHHRIVTYDFDGLKLVVRFEVDACLPSDDPESKTIRKPHIDNDDDDDDTALLGALSGLFIGASSHSTTMSSPSPLTSADLKMFRAGTQVPDSNLLEMTTRSEISAANFDWGDAYPQLYFSQTPNHYLAVHRNGTFFSIAKRRIGERDLVAIESRAQPGFRQLKEILGEIQAMVKKGGTGGRISLVCKDGVLKVHERTSKESCLPEDSLALFKRG
ncbi:hypothetical protein BDM02DRAFT_3091263 [Thelephora ganbajun]|uniref:Uncharacterized protein n=1 Tax=Thelephora ganbajun TaxID=370292 RepID=A0ACB6ZNV9_THEGA|nr:hypothetical protein BDM02DRAFT_3091263 [Thelephora ganbajun]